VLGSSRGQWVRIRVVESQILVQAAESWERGQTSRRWMHTGEPHLMHPLGSPAIHPCPAPPPPRLSHATATPEAESPVIASPDGEIRPQNSPCVEVPLRPRGGGAAESLGPAQMPGRCLTLCRHGGGDSPKLERPPLARHCHAPDGCSCCPRRGCARAR
jgi:hypothetical protein